MIKTAKELCRTLRKQPGFHTAIRDNKYYWQGHIVEVLTINWFIAWKNWSKETRDMEAGPGEAEKVNKRFMEMLRE